MENKYYTPKPYEFHIGFEFQSNYLEKDWVEKKLTLEDIAFFFDSYILDASVLEFRVKYLDKEDIENLGWEFKNKKQGILLNILIFNKKKYSLHYERGNHGIYILIKDDCADYTHFSGKINNKSELRKIMQMLNIE